MIPPVYEKVSREANSEPDFDLFPITPEHNSRIIAYLTIAISTLSAIYAGYLDNLFLILVGFGVIYPHIARILTTPFRQKYREQVIYSLILFDATAFGAISVLLGAAPVPTLLLAIMANASFITVGRITSYLLCIIFMFFGAGASLFALPGSFMPAHTEPPTVMVYIFAVGVGIYVAVTAFYTHRQARLLHEAKNQMQLKNEQYRRLSQKLAKYLSPQVWQTIFSGKKDVKLETQRKRLVVFFSDIQGFTALSEEIEPEALTELLNRYLTDMSKIALKHGGTIDKFVGDAIMVFFGDPESRGIKTDTEACVAMAIEMRRHVKVLKQRWRAQGIKTPLDVRMGINTGFCTVGNFGAESRMDYTIIGKEVNLAARLESAADAGEILVSYETYIVIKDRILCREKGHINAKGFSRPIPIFQVVDFRRDLGAQQSFTEYEFDGFSMHLDLEKVKNYERDRIISALERAGKILRDKIM